MRADLFTAAENLDAATLSSYFADDAVIVVMGNYVSQADFAQIMQNALRRLQSHSTRIQDQRIDVLGANAVAVADLAVDVDTDTSGVTSEYLVIRTEVWVRRDGVWKILHTQESISQKSM
jgi:uncharacterized protein (TIGR02246 family)